MAILAEEMDRPTLRLRPLYSVTPYTRAPKPNGFRRCPWCQDLVLAQPVEIYKRTRWRRKMVLVGVRPHPDGRVVAVAEGRWVLRRDNQVCHGAAFLAHSAWECAGVVPYGSPPGRAYPGPLPRSLTEAVIRVELTRRLEALGL